MEDTKQLTQNTTPKTNGLANKLRKFLQNLTPKKTLFIGLAVVAALLVAAVIANSTGDSGKDARKVSTQPQVTSVQLGKQGFAPGTVTIKKGTAVEWTVTDEGVAHIIAANPYPTGTELPSLKSRQFGVGTTYRYTFDTAGTYHYHDDLHPTVNGTVIVE